jgi:hypothetical protein
VENQLNLGRRQVQAARKDCTVFAHPLNVPRGYLVFVLGEDRQALDRFELRLIRGALRLGHVLERLA